MPKRMQVLGEFSPSGANILYTPQELTDEQKAQARQNIGAVPSPDSATVGQTIVVKEVDGNGKPTAWGAADFPSGGSSTFHDEIVLEDDVFSVTFQLPVPMEKILLFNVHMGGGAGISENTYVNLTSGRWSSHVGNMNAGDNALNLYGIYFSSAVDYSCRFYTSFNHGPGGGQKIGPNAHPNTFIEPGVGSNSFTLSLKSGITFSTGAKFDVWGVYAE